MNLWHLRLAVRVLQGGGLVLHATEGVWGFACDPFDAAAVTGLLALKERDVGKGLIVIGSDLKAFAEELAAISTDERERVLASWPGPVTWVLPNRRFPSWVTGNRDTVALRVPENAQARALCASFAGPLVSTSANASGRAPPRNGLQARASLSWLRRRGLSLDGRRGLSLKGRRGLSLKGRRGLSLKGRRGRCRSGVYVLPGETLGRRHPSEIRTLAGQRLRSAG